VLEIILSAVVVFLVLSPFMFLSGTVFWWIGVRVPKPKLNPATEDDDLS
jgi:hypothetical protein